MSLEATKVKNEIIKTKPKVIKIKLEEEFVENNLIDLPFIYYYKSNSKEPVTNVMYNWVGSDSVARSIEVRSSTLGVPSPYEYDLLLALQRIYIRNHNNTIYIHQNIQDDTNIDNEVNFSYRELAREMGYKTMSPQLKDKIDKSIQRLVDTNIYNKGSGLYNPMTKQYITDATKQIGILHDYSSYSYITVGVDEDGEPIKKLDRSSIKGKVSVKIDLFFLRNLIAGKGKISDKNLRLSLKIDIARKLYLLLNKWRNNRATMYIRFETLYARIPLTDDKSDYYRKRRLKEAVTELKDKGYMANYEFGNEGCNFVFISEILSLDYTDDEKKLIGIDLLLSKYNNYDEVIDRLKEHGLTEETIDKHVKLHEIPFIQALLRYIDDVGNTIENSTNYIFKCLVNDEKVVDKKYYN